MAKSTPRDLTKAQVNMRQRCAELVDERVARAGDEARKALKGLGNEVRHIEPVLKR